MYISRKFRNIAVAASLFTASSLAVAGCSSSGSTDVLNSVGAVAGQIIGTNVGGQTGEIIRQVSPNAGNIARALDNSDEGDKVAAREYEAKVLNDGAISSDVEMARYLTSITRKLVAYAPENSFNFRVRLIRSDVPNAATPGGGLILVYDRLLEELENEAQIATVIAHEIGHVIKKHPKKGLRANVLASVGAAVIGVAKPELLGGTNGQVAVLGANAALAGYSRTQEFEADQIGLELMAKAGYNVYEAPVVFQIFSSLSGQVSGGLDVLFKSHPTGSQRIAKLNGYIEEKYSDPRYSQGTVDTPEYRKLVAKYKQRKFERLAAN